VLSDCLYGKIFTAHRIHQHTNFNQEKGRFVKAIFSIVANLCEKLNGNVWDTVFLRYQKEIMKTDFSIAQWCQNTI